MRVYMVLVGAFFAQFGAHFFDTWIDANLRHGWNQMFKYTVGIGVAAPFFDALMWAFGVPEKTRRLVMLLFFAVFFSGGMGTLTGWLVRPTPNNHNGGTNK